MSGGGGEKARGTGESAGVDAERGTESEGVIEAVLPQALYRVRCDHGAVVTASFSAEARRVTVKLLPGDRVMVRLSPYDPTRGRILRRY